MVFVHSRPKSERQRMLLSSEAHASRAASSNLAPADIDAKITHLSAQIGHHSLHCGQRPCRVSSTCLSMPRCIRSPAAIIVRMCQRFFLHRCGADLVYRDLFPRVHTVTSILVLAKADHLCIRELVTQKRSTYLNDVSGSMTSAEEMGHRLECGKQNFGRTHDERLFTHY